jgi:hypothetical protein
MTVVGSATAAGEKFVSWADQRHQHGWTDVTSGGPIVEGAPAEPRCPGTQRNAGSVAFVCATEDAGRSWRRIFQAGHGLIYLRDYTRTSRLAGVVSLPRDDALPHTLRSGVFWTRDNGAHWYETSRIGPLVEHRGGRLFWHTFGGPLYEVRPWPPQGPVRCPGFFAWHAYDQRPRAKGNVCVGGVVNAGMRSTLVAGQG